MPLFYFFLLALCAVNELYFRHKQFCLSTEKEMTKKNIVFKTLSSLNVNQHTAKKGRLTYLSWSSAWAELMKLYPDSTFKVYENDSGLPYFVDQTGVMTKVSVTVESVERICWLPVMDNRNNAKKIDQTNMRDINDTIMRCLAKAIALHGLGLYIYKGEDLPDNVTELLSPKLAPAPKIEAKKPPAPAPKKKGLQDLILDSDDYHNCAGWIKSSSNLEQAQSRIEALQEKKFLINDDVGASLLATYTNQNKNYSKIPF